MTATRHCRAALRRSAAAGRMLRGFTTFDDPYGEAGVLKSKTRNMICHILRKGDEIYLVEARFDREMPEPLTLEEENQIVRGISGSLKPKATK